MTVVILLLMIAIGALIGGITNSIAIKMLFRPYRAIFIGKWRVPFTPGLIPKRRLELADQLGKLVVTHLLTAEGLKKQLQSLVFKTEMTEWIQNEARKLCKSEETIASLLKKWLGLKNPKQAIEGKVDHWIHEKLHTTVEKMKPMQLKAVIPESVHTRIDAYIPEITQGFVTKAKAYFQSEEGMARLNNMVDRFLAGRGAFGGMITMFLGNERLADKLQPEILKMLEDKGTHEMIEVFIRKEWEKLGELRLEKLEEHVNFAEIIVFLQGKVKENIPYNLLERPFSEWTERLETSLVNEIIPNGVNQIGQAISGELANLLQKLKLEEVVKNEVAEFSVERLEDIVLSISRKEFKLITFLGALLGGLIGFFQGLLILFLG